jgi:hypothetical protein
LTIYTHQRRMLTGSTVLVVPLLEIRNGEMNA